MKTILLVAPTFLDESCAVAQIVRHFVEHLHGYKVYVFCRKTNSNFVYEHVEVFEIHENKRFFYLSKFFRRIGLDDLNLLPDYEWFSWGKKATKIIEKFILSHHIDLIYTISIPCSSHLIGYSIKNKCGISWIAQFYDPWHNNPVRKYKFRFLEKYDAQLESKVATSADKILHSNYLMIKDWCNLYGVGIEKKMKVIPYITDIDLENVTHLNSLPIDGPLIISHIGNFQSFRNSLTLIKSISLLKTMMNDLAQRIQIYYVGRVTEVELKLIDALEVSDIFHIEGLKSELQCQEYFVKSHVFLAVDTNHEPNVFFPSKILKYLCYGKPIIGICKNNSVLRSELVASHNFVVDYNDVDGLKSLLYSLILDSSLLLNNDKNYGKKFLPVNVMPKYYEVLNELNIR